MTFVSFKENTRDAILSLKVAGHSGFADLGKDIVCSAVSILAYTVAQEIMYLNNDKKLLEEPEIILHDGNACITCRPKQEYYDDALKIFRFANTGYHLIAQNFPKNVKVT